MQQVERLKLVSSILMYFTKKALKNQKTLFTLPKIFSLISRDPYFCTFLFPCYRLPAIAEFTEQINQR